MAIHVDPVYRLLPFRKTFWSFKYFLLAGFSDAVALASWTKDHERHSWFFCFSPLWLICLLAFLILAILSLKQNPTPVWMGPRERSAEPRIWKRSWAFTVSSEQMQTLHLRSALQTHISFSKQSRKENPHKSFRWRQRACFFSYCEKEFVFTAKIKFR